MSSKPDDVDDLGPGFEEDEMFAHRDRFSAHERRARPHAVSEFVRRAIENTVGSMQSTGSLSRDALSYLLQQGDRGKRELVRIVANEVGQFLRGVDLSGEVVKVLTGVQLEMSATVRFRPTAEGKKIKAEVADSNVSVAPPRPPATGDIGPVEPKDDPPKPPSTGSSPSTAATPATPVPTE